MFKPINSRNVKCYRSLLPRIQTGHPFSMNDSGLHNLEQAEQKAKNLTLFSGYPNVNTDNIAQMRVKISKYIEKALIKQNIVSFSQMIEPYVRKSYRYDYEEDNDFDD